MKIAFRISRLSPFSSRYSTSCHRTLGTGARLINIFIIVFFLLTGPLMATSDIYTFQTPTQKARFEKLTGELRCLVCQNETLAESGATLASDLRKEIHNKILAGESDSDILHWLVIRYGDFILYRPPFHAATLLLWFGPLIFLIIGLFFLKTHLRTPGRPSS